MSNMLKIFPHESDLGHFEYHQIYSVDLHLTLKRRWFDMIESGEKRIEYREIKPYWINRLLTPAHWSTRVNDFQPGRYTPKYPWTHVVMMNGYSSKSRMHIREFGGLLITNPEPGWSDYPADQLVFGIVLGEAIQ